MRHQKTRHKLSRDASHRKALLANLCKEVIEHERIKTTEAKAKAVKPEIEKLITLARRGDLHARRQAPSALGPGKFAGPPGRGRPPRPPAPGPGARSGRTSSPSTSCSRRWRPATRSAPAATPASS